MLPTSGNHVCWLSLLLRRHPATALGAVTGLLANLQKAYVTDPTIAPEHASTVGSMKSSPLRLRMLHSRVAGTSFNNSFMHILPNQHEPMCSALSLRKLPFRHAKSTRIRHEWKWMHESQTSEPAALPRQIPSMPCRIRQSLSPSQQLHEQSRKAWEIHRRRSNLRLHGS